MSKYQLKMKTPSGLGTEYVYVESYRDNFERFLEEHNIKYKKYNYKTNQEQEIERLNNRINKAIEYIDMIQERRKGLSVEEYHNKWCKLFDYYESQAIMLDLLDILKGDDEE